MGLSSRNMKNQRVLEIAVTLDESDNTILITSVKTRHDGIGGESFDVKAEFNAASTTEGIAELGEALNGHTLIRIIPTVQA